MAINRTRPSPRAESAFEEGNDSNRKELSELIDKTREDLAKLRVESQEHLSDLREETRKFEVRLVEILALFVGLFTFVSIDVQIFNSEPLSVASAAGFVLITLGGITFFITLLGVLVLDRGLISSVIKNTSMLFMTLFIVIVSTLAGGSYLIWLGEQNSLKDFNGMYYSKAQGDSDITNVTQELTTLKECLKNGGWNKCLQ